MDAVLENDVVFGSRCARRRVGARNVVRGSSMAPQPWGTLCWICVTAAGMTNVPPAGLRVLSSEIMAVQVSGGVRMHVLLQLRQRAVAGRWFGFVVAVVVIEYPLTIVVVECPLNLGPQLVDDPRVALAVPVFVDARHVTAAVFAPVVTLDDLITGKEREKLMPFVVRCYA